jgi:hypothetical protein
VSEKEEIWTVRDPDGKLIGAGVGYWDATREARGNSLMGYSESERLCEGAERGSVVTVGPDGYSLTRLAALEARAETRVIRTLYEFRVIDARGNVRDEVGAFETPDDAVARCDAGWPHQGPHRAVQVALVEPTLTGGANHSTARVTEAEDVSVRTLHDDAMKACDEQRWADAVENEALALGRAVRLNVSARTRHTLAKSLISICTTIEKAALTGGASDGE